MKLSQIDWTEGKQYKAYYLYYTEKIWTVKGGALVNSLGDITEIYTLEIISEIDFEPCIDWLKIAVDTKILVRDDNDETWNKKHFARFENNKILTFWTGCTSWTHPSGTSLTPWKYAKLAESED